MPNQELLHPDPTLPIGRTSSDIVSSIRRAQICRSALRLRTQNDATERRRPGDRHRAQIGAYVAGAIDVNGGDDFAARRTMWTGSALTPARFDPHVGLRMLEDARGASVDAGTVPRHHAKPDGAVSLPLSVEVSPCPTRGSIYSRPAISRWRRCPRSLRSSRRYSPTSGSLTLRAARTLDWHRVGRTAVSPEPGSGKRRGVRSPRAGGRSVVGSVAGTEG